MGHETIRYLINLFHDILRFIYLNQNTQVNSGVLEVKEKEDIRIRVVDDMLKIKKKEEKEKEDQVVKLKETEMSPNFHASLILFLIEFQGFLGSNT